MFIQIWHIVVGRRCQGLKDGWIPLSLIRPRVAASANGREGEREREEGSGRVSTCIPSSTSEEN